MAEADIESVTALGEQLIAAVLDGHSFEEIQALVKSGAPLWYQTESEGISPLHAAAYLQNEELARYFIEQGAVWNAMDTFKNTAGDIALSFNDEATYCVLRNAGIRTELLLGLLSNRQSSQSASTLIFRATDATASGSTDEFLSSQLRYTTDEHNQSICMLKVGEEEVGVMMGWEKEIMEETVHKLCGTHPNANNLNVLNVGFGLGIIDGLFQSLAIKPGHHVIIEPHPDVLRHMKETGWYDMPGVTVIEGKWQDVVESDQLSAFGGFDVVYTDTFSEDYADLHRFFESLPDLLSGPESRFSFFNGLGATNALFYDVYTHIAELHLQDIGIHLDWSDVDVLPKDKENRWGVSRQYFTLPIYRLPIGHMNTI